MRAEIVDESKSMRKCLKRDLGDANRWFVLNCVAKRGQGEGQGFRVSACISSTLEMTEC